jgi:hypothetical protein
MHRRLQCERATLKRLITIMLSPLTIASWLIGWTIYFNASKHQHKTVRRDTKLSDNETLYIQFHVPEKVKEA